MNRNTQNTNQGAEAMTNSQYKTLKAIESNDHYGYHLHHRCYDGRVVPALIARGWATKDTDGTLNITEAGRAVVKAETHRRRPPLTTEEKIARLTFR
jgi:hypothetical protein